MGLGSQTSKSVNVCDTHKKYKKVKQQPVEQTIESLFSVIASDEQSHYTLNLY